MENKKNIKSFDTLYSELKNCKFIGRLDYSIDNNARFLSSSSERAIISFETSAVLIDTIRDLYAHIKDSYEHDSISYKEIHAMCSEYQHEPLYVYGFKIGKEIELNSKIKLMCTRPKAIINDTK